jgi:hypothetical protein
MLASFDVAASTIDLVCKMVSKVSLGCEVDHHPHSPFALIRLDYQQYHDFKEK